MPTDAFLKFDGVEGESMIRGYEKHMAILSYSWGISNNVSFASGTTGGGAGKASVQDFHFTKYLDKTSPVLMGRLLIGHHFKTVVLTLRKTTGGVQLDYLTMTLEDCCLSSYQTGAGMGGDDSIVEQLSIGFARVKIAYKIQDAKGATVGTVPASWDIQKGATIG